MAAGRSPASEFLFTVPLRVGDGGPGVVHGSDSFEIKGLGLWNVSVDVEKGGGCYGVGERVEERCTLVR